MSTSESGVVRVLVIVALATATVVMVGVSMRANYLFGVGFGQTAERRQVIGWANVAADLWKVTGLIVVMSLWRARRQAAAGALSLIWFMCLGWGLIGAIGVYAQDRTAFIGERSATVATYREAELELSEVGEKLKPLTARTPAQVEAEISAILARPVEVSERMRGTVQKLSDGCTKEHRWTTEPCLDVAKLRAEHAAAVEAEKLRTRQSELRRELVRLRQSGGAVAPDPVAELFAWLSRGQLSVRDISFGFPLAFAVLIEIVSAFGPAGIVAYAQATRRVTAEPSLPWPAAAGSTKSKVVGLLPDTSHGMMSWFLERAVPADGAVAIEDLHADYEQWCRRHGAPALTRADFAREFDQLRDMPELTGKIRKFGNRYYGIQLSRPASLTSLGSA